MSRRTSPTVAILLSLTACGGASGASSSEQQVTVFAAASLREAFTQIGSDFEAAHPGTKVVFNFGGSSALASQLDQGAPADVVASASLKNMQDVVTAAGADRPQIFARNVLTIAVPAGNPRRVTSLTDLADPGVKVAVCQPAVPCGVLAGTVFAKATLHVTPVTREADVKAVLTKVTLGEVDAGLVYLTDVRAADAKVTGIPIPPAVSASTEYPIATLTRAANPTLARAFVDAVRSPDGTAVLTAAGFAKP